MDAPSSLWIVLDPKAGPEFAAAWREGAHEHIKDCLDGGTNEAARWVVREYVPIAEVERLRADVASLTAQLQSGESFHAVAVRQRDAAWKEIEALRADAERLTGERDVAIGMLAYWCVAVDQNGTGWDDWDEHYKDAMYRPCPIRELLDKEIDAARAAQGERG